MKKTHSESKQKEGTQFFQGTDEDQRLSTGYLEPEQKGKRMKSSRAKIERQKMHSSGIRRQPGNDAGQLTFILTRDIMGAMDPIIPVYKKCIPSILLTLVMLNNINK